MAKRDKTSDIGLDDLTEDIFGLNVRAFKTVWTVLATPKRAFIAARDPNWSDRSYTPSIRLVFSVLAVITAIRFLWAGETSIFYETVKYVVGEATTFASPEDRLAYIDRVLDDFIIAFPVVFMVLHMMAAGVLRIWGSGTPYTLRLRLHFLGLIPGTLLSLVTIVALSHLSLNLWLFFGISTIVFSLALDFTTVFRGLTEHPRIISKLWRSACFALVSFIVSTLTNSLSVLAAQVWIELSGA